MSTAQNNAGLPERDLTMPEKLQGVFRKYEVRRVDGRDQPGEDRHGDEHFVLNLTRDPHAVPAIAAYARSCEPEYPLLASDLVRGLLDRDGGAFDTLVKMVMFGPLLSESIPSKAGRATLLDAGLAMQVMDAIGYWRYGATPAGVQAFVDYYGGDSLAQAKVNRYKGVKKDAAQ